MDVLFKTHKEITAQDFTDLWERGLFIFDTNIILDIYRLPLSAQVDLLNILGNEKINDRIWIPFQVLLEFSNKRLDTIGDQKNRFTAVRKIIEGAITETNKLCDDLLSKLGNLQLKKRHSAINPDKHINSNLFKHSLDSLNEFLSDLEKLDKKQPDVNDKDLFYNKVLDLFKNKIGAGFSKIELEEIYKEGSHRYSENIPPGYKDNDKDGFYLYEEKRYIRKYGDLIIWNEIIKKAKEDNLEYITLVTGDSKEDWWQERRGKKLGPRIELLNEIYFTAPNMKLFYMYDTSSFMQNSKRYLNIEIKDQSIKETKDLIEYNQMKVQNSMSKSYISSIKEFILNISRKFPLTVNFSQNFTDSIYITVPVEIMEYIFMEVFSNVLRHSIDNIVNVKISSGLSNALIIKVTNKIDENKSFLPVTRGKGIESIASLFTPKFGVILNGVEGDQFYLAMGIKSEYYGNQS